MNSGSSERIVLGSGPADFPQARAGAAYFKREDAGHLGARPLARELLARTGIDPAELDEVIVGCVGQLLTIEANVARVIALRAGVPLAVPAHTVARNCASGMQAVDAAVDRDRSRPRRALPVPGRRGDERGTR